MAINITNTKLRDETCDMDSYDEVYFKPMDSFALKRTTIILAVLGRSQVIHSFMEITELERNSCILVVFKLAMLRGRAFGKFMVSLAQDVIDDARWELDAFHL